MNHPRPDYGPLDAEQGGLAVRKSRIGALLVEEGALTETDAERVARAQTESSALFGETALAMGLVTEWAIECALARQFNYPYLLPGEYGLAPELFAAHAPFGAQSSVLRALRSRISLGWLATGRRSLAVGGVEAGDGCSTLAANLAVSFAQMGKRTLLVDTDLRQPQQHRLFGLGRPIGLADYLAGRAGMDCSVILKPFPMLRILTAGTVPPNPQELLSRPAFSELVKEASEQFDVVIMDVPPLMDEAGALEVATQLDGLLLVAPRDKTRLERINAAWQQMEQACAERLGVVLFDALVGITTHETARREAGRSMWQRIMRLGGTGKPAVRQG